MKNKTIKLYYHKTDGGAEYLCSSAVEGSVQLIREKNKKAHNYDEVIGQTGEGSFDSKYIVRIDGDITKDAELTIK